MLRGVNLSGGEFGTVDAVGNTNTYASGAGSDPPTLAELTYLSRRGIRYVRVAFRQELLQPSFGGPLRRAGVSAVTSVLDAAQSAGLVVNLDWHNYGRFFLAGREVVLGGADYPFECFEDFHARVGAAFEGHPALHALSLTNEPHDLPPAHMDTATATPLYRFDDGTQGWEIEGYPQTCVSQAPLPSGTGAPWLRAGAVLERRADPFGSNLRLAGGAGFDDVHLERGDSLVCDVLIPTSTPGRWRVTLRLRDRSWGGEDQARSVSTDVPQGKVTSLELVVPDSRLGTNHRGLVLQFEVDGNDGSTPSVVFVGRVGRTNGGHHSTWETASQRAVAAGRRAGYTGWYSVAADGWSSARDVSVNHPRGWWVEDPLRKSFVELHYYPDRDNSGVFQHTLADEDAHAVGLGYRSHRERVQHELQRGADWCRQVGVKGYLGETGWMQSGRQLDGRAVGAREAARWNSEIAESIFAIADTAGLDVTVWTAGAYPSSYESLVYDLDRMQTTSMSSVVEAHPSRIV